MNIWDHKELPESTEVVVIGGGIAGVSAAYHLAKAGVEVVLFEAGRLACRASGRNDGQMLLGLGEHYNRVVSQFGATDAGKLFDFIRKNNEQLKCKAIEMNSAKLIPRGGIHFAETQAELRELQESAGLLGANHCKLLTDGDVKERFPVEGFCGALELPGEATVNPKEMTKGLARLAEMSGAKIFTYHKVSNVRSQDCGHVVELVDGRKIDTVIVVYCVSAFLRNKDFDPGNFFTNQVFPYRGQIIATEPLDAELIKPFDGYAMSSNFCYEYFRTYDNRFVLGGMRHSVKGQEENTTDDQVINDEVTKNLLGYVEKHFPTLKGIGFPNEWTGIMAGTNDGLPLVGQLPGGIYTSSAFNGYGLSFAYKAGEIIKEQIVDGKATHPAAALFNPKRFV